MLVNIEKIPFGGGCHWCTEAVFQSLKGVIEVEQGFVSSDGENESFSEAVIVHFDIEKIILKTLVEIHLLTHKSTSEHAMRKKYRSAIYYFDRNQKKEVVKILDDLQARIDSKIITKILAYKSFKSSDERFLNYYFNNPSKPFCETYINPKLQVLMQHYGKYVDAQRLKIPNYESH